MVFGLFEAAVASALNIVDDTFSFDGDGPKKADVARLIDAGLTVAAISAGYGLAEDVIQSIIEE